MSRSLTPAAQLGRVGWRIVLAWGMVTAGCAKVSTTGVEPDDGAASVPSGGSSDAAATDMTVGDVPPPKPPCVNLQCQQVRCAGGETTISGTAFAPNGTLPLYNVMVYVPNGPLEPFKAGLTCDRCGALVSGRPLVTAISDHEGKFKIANVPAGTNIPLVLQVGKWRRQITIPTVVPCQDNPIADAQLTRLPRNRQEGDMPRIAVTTGECDLLGCLLPKLGIDTAELGIAGEDKAVTFYKGNNGMGGGGLFDASVFGPPNMTVAATLWRKDSELEKHDLMLLSCECDEVLENKGVAAFDAMTNYLARGGRIFGSDFMYVWYRDTPDPKLAATLDIIGGAPLANGPMTIDTTFPKGKALADWMKFVDPMVTYGQIPSEQVFANLRSAMPAATQVWATSTGRGSMTSRPRIVTINTPAGVPSDQQCGRAVHLDAHISPLDIALPASLNFKFPKDCGTKLNKGEEALAFLFFDLAACIQKDTTPVEPPPIVVP